MKAAGHLGMPAAAVAGLTTALPSPAQQQPRTMRSSFSYSPTDGIQGTGRADMNLFTVSGMIRF